jgi:hypothetical protein
MACKFGARRVYAVEPDNIISVAREAALANGCADRIEFFESLSTEISLPEPASIIISDLRGVLPWFEQHIPSIIDARERLLARGGALIPRRDVLWAAVVEAPEHYEDLVGPWRKFNLDLSAGTRLITNQWRKSYSVLAEDVVTLDDRGDRFLVRPGYPCIRLWPPAVKALYGSETHLPKLTPNWDKCYLDLSAQFQGEALPLAAIYQLGERHHDSAAPFIETLDRSEALMALVANTYATKLMDKLMRAREFELLTRVVGNVSVRRVTPHADPARITELCNLIVDDFSLTQRRKAAKDL